MDPIKFYRGFDQEFFYSFHKHSSDIELDELGKRYSLCLDRRGQTLGEILTGKRSPKKLRDDTLEELHSLAASEGKFANDLPLNVQADHFESETGFSQLPGELRRLVEGRSHVVRLVKPAEYDKNYWFYTQGENPPQNVYCREFGMDLLEFLRGVRSTNKAKLMGLRRAISFRKEGIYQFWALAPYVHLGLMQLGCEWSSSIGILIKIASKRYAQGQSPFTGHARFQLGYDERMPTHLIARLEAMRDIEHLKKGDYAKAYGIELPHR